MEITIHETLNRPWGPESPYTADDNGTIYNGFLPVKSATENQVIDAVNALKAIKNKKETEVELNNRKEMLQNEIDEIDRKIAELGK